MITNERQYRITRKKALDFVAAIEAFDAGADERADVHPRLLQAEREAMESRLADLRAELDEYEQLKSAAPSVSPVASLEELAEGLIKARIAGTASEAQGAARPAVRGGPLRLRQLSAAVPGRARPGRSGRERNAAFRRAV